MFIIVPAFVVVVKSVLPAQVGIRLGTPGIGSSSSAKAAITKQENSALTPDGIFCKKRTDQSRISSGERSVLYFDEICYPGKNPW